MRDLREWADENGSNRACEVCGRKVWVETGCAALCDGCEYGDEPEQERDTLASLGLSEDDFR
jgi:hypothetical protein